MQIQCPTCQFVWCFKCHSPWHEGVNCKEYKKGDKLLRHWASEIEHGQRNAQKCPKCKVRHPLGGKERNMCIWVSLNNTIYNIEVNSMYNFLNADVEKKNICCFILEE